MTTAAAAQQVRAVPHHGVLRKGRRRQKMRRLRVSILVKEPFNAVSHLAGFLFALIATAILVTLAALNASLWHVAAFGIYGICMALMYGASTAYHALPLKPSQEKLFRRIDHSMIYFMIAGSYTPIAFVGLRDVWGIAMLAIVWGLAFYGVSEHVKHHRKKRPFHAQRWKHTALYLLMGWLSVAFLFRIADVFSLAAVGWLLAGGLSYTGGAIVYALKRPDPWGSIVGFHGVFHIFVLVGSMLHFWMMVAYILPFPA